MKEEIAKMIWKKMDELRTSIHFSGYGRFSSTSTLERIGNEIGVEQLQKVISDTNLFKTANSPMQVMPKFLYDFIKLFVNDLKPKSIFDPWLTRDSYPIIENFENFKGNTINQDEYELLVKGLLKDLNKITLGDGLENLENEPSKFDLIVTFPPFVMPSRKPNSTSKDYATDLLIESANKLNENGKLFFLMPQKFLFDKRIQQTIAETNISIDGVFFLEEGSHYPITSISTYLIVASVGENNSTFTAKISSDQKSNEIIYKNFINKKDGKKIQLGKFIDLQGFNSFKALEKEENLYKLGKRTGLQAVPLNDVSLEINTIRDIKQEDVEHKPNSIYVPKVGNSNVVHNPSDFNIKPKNYLQIVLNDNISPIFISNYFNTTIGKLSLESRKVGTTIENITISSINELPLFIPEYQEQIKLIEVNNKIENISLAINELKEELWNRPSLVDKIDKEISSFEKDNSIEKWLDNLPFPISSILWKYYATTDNRNKTEHLLHFFEAFSEFLSLLMLSALNQNQEFYKSERHRWISNDKQYKDWIKKTTFGGWNNLTASLAKATRTLLNEKENKEIVLSLYGNPSNEFLEFITNKKVITILEEVREYRNKWKGHGGVSSNQEDLNRVTLLEQKLNNLRQEIKDAFANCKLIVAESSKYKNGVFIYKTKELVGIRTPFNEVEIESLIPLDESKLYFLHDNQNKPIELLPFIKYNQESKACYFYNSIESNDIRFVSFHFEQNAEFTEVLDEKFEEVLAILRQDEN
jgi:hypothetical protein